MTGPNKDDAARTSGASRVRSRGLRSSLTGTRWGMWLCSLFVAAGAVLLVTLIGTGGAATQVPSALQVGHQATTVTSSLAATSRRPGALSPTTTTTAVTHRTTVINPLSTVTDHQDSSGDKNSSGDSNSSATNAGSATSTTATTPSTSTTTATPSTSVNY